MGPSPNRRALIGIDTNVLLDLAGEIEDVTDALLTIRLRLASAQLVMPPTVGHELAYQVKRALDPGRRRQAMRAFRLAHDWNIMPAELIPVAHGIAERVGRRFREAGLLPEAEVNDGLIVAEAALLNCSLLVTSDAHLRGIDFVRLAFELHSFDLPAPVIATPREIVRRFLC